MKLINLNKNSLSCFCFLVSLFIFFSNHSYANITSDCLQNADVGDNAEGIDINDINIPKAKEICELALKNDKKNIRVIRSLGRIYYQEKDYKRSLPFVIAGTEKNDAYSEYLLAQMYKHGNGIKKNPEKSFQFMNKSASKNFKYALINIGFYFEDGIGVPVNLDIAFKKTEECAKRKIIVCLYNMAIAYKEGRQNQKVDVKKFLFYVDQLIEENYIDAYGLKGVHLLENAKSKSDIQTGLLYCEKSKTVCTKNLILAYLFPEDLKFFSELHTDKEKNKKTAIKLFHKLFKNIEKDDKDETSADENINFFAEMLYYPIYTKVLSKAEISIFLEKFKKIAVNDNKKYSRRYANIAAHGLSDYYQLGYFEPKNIKKAIFYLELAAYREDDYGAVNAAWLHYLSSNYETAKKLNNQVISSSNDPYLKLYAYNNNGVIDFDLFGRGTDYQLDQYKKAVEIVKLNNYELAWPFSNLFRAYFFPNHNKKLENLDIQSLELADKYLNGAIAILEKNSVDQNELNEISHLKFIMKSINRLPTSIKEAEEFLIYAALNGYNRAYLELAWLYMGYKKNNFDKEIYKWNYVCTILIINEEDNQQCEKDKKQYEKKISFYDKSVIKEEVSNFVRDKEITLAELEKSLNPIIPLAEKNVKNFGNYHALLIGINSYKYFQDLKTPINDVNRLDKILKQKYKFTTNKLINPSRRDVLKQINKYTKTLSKSDNLIIYFAGHGMQKSQEGFWLTKEAEKDDDIDWISNNTIVRKLREIKSNNVLVIADSCFSGLLTRGLNIENNSINESPLEILHRSKSRIAITSGGNEPVLDGGGGENSIFAASLASELEKRSNAFSASELFLSIQKKVIKETLSFGIKQSPIILDIPKSGHENFDFIFNPN